MANRDFNKIERTIKDFSQNIGGSGSGMKTVKSLPKKGDLGTLYKMPNGDIYSWFHAEETEAVTVYDNLEVGKTYYYNDTIEKSLFLEKMGTEPEDFFYVNIPDEELSEMDIQSVNYWLAEDGVILEFYYYYKQEGPTPYASYGSIENEDYMHFNTQGYIDNSLTITEALVNKFEEAGVDINKLAFLFTNASHEEYVTTVKEGYEKVNGAFVLDRDKINNYEIYLDDANYNAQIIYDTLLRGGSAVLKFDNSPDGYSYSTMTGFSYEYDEKGKFWYMGIDFPGTTISLVLKNKYEWSPTKMTGQEIVDGIQFENIDFAPSGAFGYSQYYFIELNPDEEILNKELADGIILSLLDDTFAIRLQKPDPSGETPMINMFLQVKLPSGETREEEIELPFSEVDEYTLNGLGHLLMNNVEGAPKEMLLQILKKEDLEYINDIHGKEKKYYF